MSTKTEWPSSLDDKELEELDRYLRSHTGEGDLLLDGVHGLLSALAVGPLLVLPDEWLPEVLHEPFADENEGNRVLALLAKLNDSIAAEIEVDAYEPILGEVELETGPMLSAAGWCEGFSRGIDLRASPADCQDFIEDTLSTIEREARPGDFVLLAALRKGLTSNAGPDADLSVYRDQFAEIERDLARGTIGPDEAARLRAEVGKRLLDADRKRGATGAPEAAEGKAAVRSRAGVPAAVPALIAAVMLPGALATYWWLGAPGYPDMALKPRLQALDEGIAARPDQEADGGAAKRAQDGFDERGHGVLSERSEVRVQRSGRPEGRIRFILSSDLCTLTSPS